MVIGVLVSVWMLGTRPEAKTRPKQRNATLVETSPIVFGSQTTKIHALGLVKPSRTVELRPQVSGEIIRISDQFLPGGKIKTGGLRGPA